MKLTAMTYNIFSGKNLQRDQNLNYAAEVIRSVQPDFVALNEVRSHTSDVGNINQAMELGRLTGYYPLFARAIDILGGEYGNAFLSRLPVLEYQIIHVPDPEIREGDYYYEHRCILRCVLKAGEHAVTVFCTHFGLAPAEQKNAVQTILALLQKETNPVLMMGDLNAEPGSGELKPLLDALHDTAAGTGILTFPSDQPRIKIDYILHSEPFRTLNVRSLNTQNSDHRPLIAELMIG